MMVGLNRVLEVGTACSGSEVLMLATQKLAAKWSEAYGVRLLVKHVFAMESEGYKQKWILKHFHPIYLFDDMTAMIEGNQIHDVISKSLQTPPAVDFYAAGFECDTISPLNSKSQQGKDVVSSGAGKTGRTAQGAVAYIRKRRPKTFLLENVKNINTGGNVKTGKKSDLQVLIEWFNEMGYYISYRCLQAAEYGAICSRDRYYLFGVKCGKPHSLTSQLVSGWEPPAWFVQFEMLLHECKIDPLPVESFLLPDSHAYVRHMKAEFQQIAIDAEQRASSKKPKKGEEKWHVDHLQAFQEVGLEWPPTWDADFDYMVAGRVELGVHARFSWKLLLHRREGGSREAPGRLPGGSQRRCFCWRNLAVGICVCL